MLAPQPIPQPYPHQGSSPVPAQTPKEGLLPAYNPAVLQAEDGMQQQQHVARP